MTAPAGLAGAAAAPPPAPEFGLKEAISLKHAYVDQSHKFWAYFQLAGAAVTGFAWQAKTPTNSVLISLAVGFLFFAIGNNRLVVDAQAAAYEVSEAIDDYIATHPTAPASPRLGGVANLRKLDEPEMVRWTHGILAIVVVGLILVRLQ